MRWVVWFPIVLLAVASASAQEAPQVLEFSFSNPGARSMGLGGAFVALADDATAAFANPAGLVQLARPEVSLEVRRRDYSTPYTEGGRAVGAPTGWGIDTVDGLRTGYSNESISGVSFLSFVYPWKKWSLALFRHQVAEFRFGTEINGLFGDAPEGGTRRYEDQLSTTDLDVVGTGISGAYRVSDRLSLGFGVTFYSGRVESEAAIHSVDSFPETFWERNSFLPDRNTVNSSFAVDDTDVGFNIGILWSFAEYWRLGVVYRSGPRFDYELYNIAGPLNHNPEGTILAAVLDQSIEFPDVWGVGIAYRSPGGSVTVGFEWDRVEYTAILETLGSSQVDTTDVSVGNADELRLGCEYVFMKSQPLIAIRGGVWHDPDHRFRYEGDDPFTRALYPPGGDTTHFTVGAGIAFSKFQIDLGADFSDVADAFTLSAIYGF